MKLDLAVVVLNWNGGDDTIACLDSLAASTLVPEVILVDNASSDGSLEAAAQHPVVSGTIANGSNRGFAAGNNAGLARALSRGARFICVLNNDATVDANTLRLLCERLERTDAPLAVSPQIRYAPDRPAPWFAGGVIDRELPRHLQADELGPGDDAAEHATEFVSGCCLAASAETWRRVGRFDERYFLMFEDVDWSLRARDRGVRLRIVDEALVHHRVSRSFRSAAADRLGAYYYARNGLLFNWEHGRRYTARFAREQVLRHLLRSLRGGAHPPPRGAWRGLGLVAFALGWYGRAPAALERVARRDGAGDLS